MARAYEKPPLAIFINQLSEIIGLVLGDKPRLPTEFYSLLFSDIVPHYEKKQFFNEIAYEAYITAVSKSVINVTELVSQHSGSESVHISTIGQIVPPERVERALTYHFGTQTYDYPTFSMKHILAYPSYLKMDEEDRFEHTWICAPQGTGKTNLLENLIMADLPKVLAGKASIFVLDSQNTLVSHIASQVPPEKMVFLEVNEQYPLSLNIFDSTTIDYSVSLDLADFVIAGLLGSELTGKQAGIFRYIAQALQVIPDANIHTFAELLTKEGYAKHSHHFSKLHPYVANFFATRFTDPTFAETKKEIHRRLDDMMSMKLFLDMFSHTRNRVNLYDELGQAKVICINTNKGQLQSGTAVLGRLFIAMLLQATKRRMLIAPEEKMPVYAYIDECHDYIADEPKIAEFIDQARKQRVALTLAHQRMAQLGAGVLNAVTNARTTYASRNKADLAPMARLLGVEQEVLQHLPKYSFIMSRGTPQIIKVPPSNLSLNAARMKQHRERMKQLYCAEPLMPQTAPAITPTATPAPKPQRPPQPSRNPRRPASDIEF